MLVQHQKVRPRFLQGLICPFAPQPELVASILHVQYLPPSGNPRWQLDPGRRRPQPPTQFLVSPGGVQCYADLAVERFLRSRSKSR